jgi:hypothetical protein
VTAITEPYDGQFTGSDEPDVIEVDDDPVQVLGAIILDAIADLTAKVDALAVKVDALEEEARPVLDSLKGTAEKIAQGGIMGMFR